MQYLGVPVRLQSVGALPDERERVGVVRGQVRQRRLQAVSAGRLDTAAIRAVACVAWRVVARRLSGRLPVRLPPLQRPRLPPRPHRFPGVQDSYT